VGRNNGVSDRKLFDVERYAESELFTERERLALTYAERMTITSEEVTDELFEQLKAEYSQEEIIELTCTIAFENFLSKFHRALRVESQGFCPVRPPAQH
jgi:alkylhydroperoxidase family enzyme